MFEVFYYYSCLSCIENLPICADSGHIKSEEQQQNLAEDVGVESSATTGANKQTSEDDTKIPYSVYQAFAHVLKLFCLHMSDHDILKQPKAFQNSQ